jgi:hypothetical protein
MNELILFYLYKITWKYIEINLFGILKYKKKMPPSYGDPCGPVIDAFLYIFFLNRIKKKILNTLKYLAKKNRTYLMVSRWCHLVDLVVNFLVQVKDVDDAMIFLIRFHSLF